MITSPLPLVVVSFHSYQELSLIKMVIHPFNYRLGRYLKELRGSGGHNKNKSIYVQIASYRDPQLKPTIRDCLSKAKYPQNLVFGICWQRDESENLDEFITDARFKVIEVSYKDSKGVCWARNQIQQKYSGEDYTLQIDSHHRFIRNWDVKCIDMLESLRANGFSKPILTTYAPSFDPQNDPHGRGRVPWKMKFERFTPEGFISVHPATIPVNQRLKMPIASRFYSAHFAFTLGGFCKEVQHDPNCYFHGEEINIAVRAFSHGYDLFHPHKIVIWHEYTRRNRIKHWEDHRDWYKRNDDSLRRNRILFGMEKEKIYTDFGKYGFGNKRSLKDFEKYAGINFKLRAVQQYTLESKTPPNPQRYSDDQDWLDSFCKQQRCRILLGRDEIPKETDCDFWYIGAHNRDGEEIFRQDVTGEEIKCDINVSRWEKVMEFWCDDAIATWTVWPHSRTKGWLDRISKVV
jgi:glycosyltransferase involved in cell wall biosynthesis